MQSNVIKTMIFVSAFFVITWTPLGVYYLLIMINSNLSLLDTGYYALTSFAFVYICTNPFIYTTKISKLFRLEALHTRSKVQQGAPQRIKLRGVDKRVHMLMYQPVYLRRQVWSGEAHLVEPYSVQKEHRVESVYWIRRHSQQFSAEDDWTDQLTSLSSFFTYCDAHWPNGPFCGSRRTSLVVHAFPMTDAHVQWRIGFRTVLPRQFSLPFYMALDNGHIPLPPPPSANLQLEMHDKIFHFWNIKKIHENFEIFQHPFFEIFHETFNFQY